MPRRARAKSETGIYHVIFRSINQQQLFEDTEDYEKYLRVLNDYKATCGYELLAYCLMGNHIHLLIKEGAETPGQIFKRIGGRYVYWYNAKYKRSGHLFQDRYKSEAVHDDAYLLTVLRYIHKNPVKAGMVRRLEDYRWSSYNEYLKAAAKPVVDDKVVFGMMTREEFVQFHGETENDQCLEITEPRVRMTDEEAGRIIKKLTGCETVAAFQALDSKNRDAVLRKLKKSGASIRQASRLTGISKGIVERVFGT